MLDELRGTTDSEVVVAVLRTRVRGGAPLVDAVRSTVRDVLDVADARLNLLVVADGLVVATRWGDSLSARVSPTGGPIETARSCWIASEPIDDEPWIDVPDRSMVIATIRGLEITSIPGG